MADAVIKALQFVVQRIVVEDHRITIEHVVPSGRFDCKWHIMRPLGLVARAPKKYSEVA